MNEGMGTRYKDQNYRHTDSQGKSSMYWQKLVLALSRKCFQNKTRFEI